MLERRENESALDHQKRLVYGKLVDKTLADWDYSELAKYAYGKEYAPDVARRMFYGSCRTFQLMDEDEEQQVSRDNTQLLSEIEEKKIELQKERQRFFDQRAAFNKVVRERARQEELNDIVTRAVTSGNLPSLDTDNSNSVEVSDNDLLVSLSDIHYGANVDNYWCKYNSEICAQMMRDYADKVIKIAQLHNSENCIIWANGDEIAGNIHLSIQVSNKENVIEQVTGVSELIANFISLLAPWFKTVSFVSVAGNHSRIDKKDDAIKDERMDDLIEWYLKARFQDCSHIGIGTRCSKIDSTMYAMTVRGNLYLGVHGDFDQSPTSIQTLQTFAEKPVYAVLMGHMHHSKGDVVQGIRMVMAGSFLGMDDYCITRRLYSKPEQTVLVVDDNGIRCRYDIPLMRT